MQKVHLQRGNTGTQLSTLNARKSLRASRGFNTAAKRNILRTSIGTK